MRRISERREQYRQVRAHVEKDDGRLRAYGWSLPAKVPAAGAATTAPGSATRPSSAEPVPVPVYCRPLTETETGSKVTYTSILAGQTLAKALLSHSRCRYGAPPG